jgi:uncharacterized glyoxalase superfamily protein PhnB
MEMTMSLLKNQKKMMIIVYVADQKRSKDFYQGVLDVEPILDVPGMTEFELFENVTLGIMPEKGIARILGNEVPHPETGNGIPRCEIYLFVNDPDASYKKLIETGGKGVSPAEERSWGDVVSYGADPDGHILAFACKKTH